MEKNIRITIGYFRIKVPCVQQTMSHDSTESSISYNFLVKDEPLVLNPLGERSSSSSPIEEVLVGPFCATFIAVGMLRQLRVNLRLRDGQRC